MQCGCEFITQGHKLALAPGSKAVEFGPQRFDVDARPASKPDGFFPHIVRLANGLALEAVLQSMADRLGQRRSIRRDLNLAHSCPPNKGVEREALLWR